MDFERFVRFSLSSEIKKALYHCEKRNDPFILWQNVLNQDQRIKKNSSLIKYNIDKEEIALKPKRGSFSSLLMNHFTSTYRSEKLFSNVLFIIIHL